MTTEIATRQPETRLQQAGQAANHAAAQHVFGDYRSRKARNTLTRQDDDLTRFTEFLNVVRLNSGASAGDLLRDTDLSFYPECWQGVTWGLVRGFVEWLFQQGFSIGSINVRLSTVKTYAKLATQAGVIQQPEYAMIRTVGGYRFSEGLHADETREKTRIGYKKADPVVITSAQVALLKKQPNTPQGRRDRLLVCLLADLGLRVGEVVGLRVESVNLEDNTITFWREKISKEQTHRMTNGLLDAMRSYLQNDAPLSGALLRGSLKSGALTSESMNRFSIAKRIAVLGESVGVAGLSPHDLRHNWASRLAEKKTPIDRLMSAGGWSSPAMPLRYVVAAKVANEGIDVED